MRTVGTVARGIRAPIIRQGDNIAAIAAKAVIDAWEEAGIQPKDKDVCCGNRICCCKSPGQLRKR